MNKLYTIFFLLAISININASDDLEYQKNLIACQHGFSSCELKLLNTEDASNIDFAEIELSEGIKVELAQNSPSSTSTINPGSISGKLCAENGSCYGDISAATGRPKTVAVQGYYRKDGTYVKGHYRSSPKKK